MARKKLTSTNPPLSDEEEAPVRNDAVKETKPEEPASPLPRRESVSDSEDDDSENTAPSPNVSDFVIKPIVRESTRAETPSSKRSAPSEPSGSASLSKKERIDPPPFVILGLPVQDSIPALPKKVSRKKSGSKQKLNFEAKYNVSDKKESGSKTKLDSEPKDNGSPNIDSKRLNQLLRKAILKLGVGNGLAALDMGTGVMMGGGEQVKVIDDKWKKLQKQMLELYLQRLDFVQEHTKLVLDKLKSS